MELLWMLKTIMMLSVSRYYLNNHARFSHKKKVTDVVLFSSSPSGLRLFYIRAIPSNRIEHQRNHKLNDCNE